MVRRVTIITIKSKMMSTSTTTSSAVLDKILYPKQDDSDKDSDKDSDNGWCSDDSLARTIHTLFETTTTSTTSVASAGDTIASTPRQKRPYVKKAPEDKKCGLYRYSQYMRIPHAPKYKLAIGRLSKEYLAEYRKLRDLNLPLNPERLCDLYITEQRQLLQKLMAKKRTSASAASASVVLSGIPNSVPMTIPAPVPAPVNYSQLRQVIKTQHQSECNELIRRQEAELLEIQNRHKKEQVALKQAHKVALQQLKQDVMQPKSVAVTAPILDEEEFTSNCTAVSKIYKDPLRLIRDPICANSLIILFSNGTSFGHLRTVCYRGRELLMLDLPSYTYRYTLDFDPNTDHATWHELNIMVHSCPKSTLDKFDPVDHPLLQHLVDAYYLLCYIHPDATSMELRPFHAKIEHTLDFVHQMILGKNKPRQKDATPSKRAKINEPLLSHPPTYSSASSASNPLTASYPSTTYYPWALENQADTEDPENAFAYAQLLINMKSPEEYECQEYDQEYDQE